MGASTFSLTSGRLTLIGQSAAGIGMIDGWNVQTDFGSITFQNAANDNVVPEPGSLAIFGIGAMGCAGLRRRKKPKAQ